MTSHGRYAAWIRPSRGRFGRLCTAFANSHFARALGGILPPPPLASDITDVIYVNYLVEADRLASMVPAGLQLQRLGPDGRWALFTFLTYRHGHFGPVLLRHMLPSPIQSNWRIYVTNPATDDRGVYFITTCIASTIHAIAARMLCEGVPMHVPQRAELRHDDLGAIHLLLDSGAGTSPDVRATFHSASEPILSPPWSDCFGNYHEFLAYCVPQDRALSSQPWASRVARQEIQLGIALQDCQPLEGSVSSVAAERITGGTCRPNCVAHVRFRFITEQFDRVANQFEDSADI